MSEPNQVANVTIQDIALLDYTVILLNRQKIIALQKYMKKIAKF